MKDINVINELNLDEQLKRGATRRTVVTTGAKLAYAVPLVAATVSLTASGALAVCGGTTPNPFAVRRPVSMLRLLPANCLSLSKKRDAKAGEGSTGQRRFRRLPGPYWLSRATSAPWPASPARM